MKSKKEFLKTLEENLREINYKDIDNLLEYYDELIEDKKEQKKSEAKILEEIGSVDEIIKNLKVEITIEEAEENPTVAKSSKALIAVLGVLSLPMLIPAISIVFAFAITAFALFVAFIAVMGAFIVSSVAIMIAVLGGLFSFTLPFGTAFVSLGIALILLVLSIEMFKLLTNSTKTFSIWSIKSLKKVMKGKNKNE